MHPQSVCLFVPFSIDTPWIVRGEVARVGTYLTRSDAVAAALAVRAKLARAWHCEHPPVRVQEPDGSWHDVSGSDDMNVAAVRHLPELRSPEHFVGEQISSGQMATPFRTLHAV